MISKRIIGFIFFLIIGATMNAQTKKYFIHLTSDPIKNPSAALMSIHAASEALSQGHEVTYFAAADGVQIFMKDVISNIHAATKHGGGDSKMSEMAISKLEQFSREGGVIHVSEGSFMTYGVTQENASEMLIRVENINWSYPKQLIEESAKADLVFSY